MEQIIDRTIQYLRDEYHSTIAADAPLDLDRIVAHNDHGTPISLRNIVRGALAYASSSSSSFEEVGERREREAHAAR